MPRMPKYLKEEWAFFLDERGRKKYNELCRKCERSCKQSFRATVIHCPHYAILFIRGELPVMDLKYDILKHPEVSLTADGKGGVYEHGKVTSDVATIEVRPLNDDIPRRRPFCRSLPSCISRTVIWWAGSALPTPTSTIP